MKDHFQQFWRHSGIFGFGREARLERQEFLERDSPQIQSQLCLLSAGCCWASDLTFLTSHQWHEHIGGLLWQSNSWEVPGLLSDFLPWPLSKCDESCKYPPALKGTGTCWILRLCRRSKGSWYISIPASRHHDSVPAVFSPWSFFLSLLDFHFVCGNGRTSNQGTDRAPSVVVTPCSGGLSPNHLVARRPCSVSFRNENLNLIEIMCSVFYVVFWSVINDQHHFTFSRLPLKEYDGRNKSQKERKEEREKGVEEGKKQRAVNWQETGKSYKKGSR